MNWNDEEYERLRIGKLSVYQTGIAFLCIAPLLFGMVGYQIITGRVLSKSGSMPLEPGLPWLWLAIEFGIGVLGIYRGLKMIRR